MKIFGIVTHDNPGGAQLAMAKLRRGLEQRGHQFTTIYLYRTQAGMAKPEDVVLYPRRPDMAGYGKIIWTLYRHLRQNPADGAIAFLPLACALGLTMAWITGIPRRIASQRNPRWSYSAVMRFVDISLGRLGIFTRVVANSEATAESFRGLNAAYDERMVNVANCVEIAATDGPLPMRDGEIAETGPTLLSVARLSAQKNIEVLLEALVHIPTVTLLLAGHGERQHSLEDLAERLGIGDRICFLGHVPPRDIVALYRRATIYVHSALYEGQSNATLEAIAYGCPIVSSDIPPQREVLTMRDGSLAGHLVPANDVFAWIEAIQDLLNNAAKRHALAARALERAGDFTLDAMARGFEDALKKEGQTP